MEFNAGELPVDDIGELNINIRNILLATDGSAPAIMATQYAIALAKQLGARVKAIFVDSSESLNTQTDAFIDRDALKEIRPTAAGLDVAKLYAAKNGVECDISVISGSAAKKIIEAAGEFKADIIVVGNMGRTGLRRLALGSVAEAVVKSSHIPVLVLKAN